MPPSNYVGFRLLNPAKRTVVASLAAFLVVLFPASSLAGHYDVSYSGGTGTSAPDGSSSGFSLGTDRFWGGGGSASANPSGWADSVGPLTATLTWAPDYTGDLPPVKVVILEECTASWSGQGYYPPTGTASNGLGSAEIVTTFYFGAEGSSSGERYTIVSGGATVAVPACSPHSHVNGTMAMISAGVQYRVTPMVPQVVLNGTTIRQSDLTRHILIGQGCTASVSVFPGGPTFSNYNWTIGGDTFKSYVAHGIASGGAAHVDFLTSADLAAPSPHWYWRSAGGSGGLGVLVSGSADAYVNGVLIGRVTAEKWLTLWVPYYFCGYNARNVTIDIDIANNVFIGAGTWAQNGIVWTGQAIPPDVFDPPGRGIWAFVQTAIIQRSYTDNGVQMCSPYNGLPGLDTSYPYAPDGGIMQADDSNAGWLDDDAVQTAGDKPALKNVGNSVSNVNFNDQFWTYMMYRPVDKGYGCQWVPLHQIAWQWNVNVNRPGNAWTGWPGPFPSILGQVHVTVDQRWTVHPVWTRVITAGNSTPCP